MPSASVEPGYRTRYDHHIFACKLNAVFHRPVNQSSIHFAFYGAYEADRFLHQTRIGSRV
ncbi:unnamed protein product [Protopolystoma xenopodis]|uniref:Uncharacterized protein n=1 Tax=Protopolystoma xenopodis TaxID=117903 RepID=A0A3S5AYX4_9PLAT|nr:unnamed protein product [Protopolystoma xenopodis]